MDMINARIAHKTDTTAHWNEKIGFIPLRGEIIIYSDYNQIDDGYGGKINIPGIKIGDGSAYLIDLPFIGSDARYDGIYQELHDHIDNEYVHVTPENKEFWNNKLNYEVQNGNLILTRE